MVSFVVCAIITHRSPSSFCHCFPPYFLLTFGNCLKRRLAIPRSKSAYKMRKDFAEKNSVTKVNY